MFGPAIYEYYRSLSEVCSPRVGCRLVDTLAALVPQLARAVGSAAPPGWADYIARARGYPMVQWRGDGTLLAELETLTGYERDGGCTGRRVVEDTGTGFELGNGRFHW